MNNITENENYLPPAFMATTRQKILLKSHQSQVQEYAMDYPQSPIVNAFLTIGNAAVNMFSSLNK